jgi:hypothetical protein
METETRSIFEIPAENMSKFQEQMVKLSKKSVRLIGLPIAPLVFSHETREMADGQKHRVYSVMLTAQVPQLEGWTFVARLDHANETGTVIRMVPNTGVELPEQYRHAKNTTCDHCRVNRYRRDTFVIRNDETGIFKQVGSQCLKDFFGHDPYKIAKLAELLGYADECARGATHFDGHADLRFIDLEDFLNYAAHSVLTNGWVSGKAAFENERLTSTRENASIMMHIDSEARLRGRSAETIITEADRALAAAALEWAQSLGEKSSLNDYEHNVLVIANATMIEPRSMGIAASIVGVHYMNVQRSQPTVSRTAEINSFHKVAEFLAAAKPKFPKIRLQLEDKRPIVLSVAGPDASCPGTINITDGGPYGSNIWYGRVSRDGKWTRSNKVDQSTMTSLVTLLTALGNDPAGVAASYGHLTGHCCMCNRPLSDERSTRMGYGSTCAKKWNLPYN